MGFTRIIPYLNVMRSLGSVVMLWIMLFFYAAQAQAGQITLAWDASTSAGVAGYQLYYGQASGGYTDQVDVGNQVAYTLTGLQDGTTYYFAVKAYAIGKLIWSGFSNEVNAPIGASAPTASFTATPTSGPAPLAVTFDNTSTGNITTWLWDFGDGTTSTAKTPGKSYAPGTYDVSLEATGPGGTDIATRLNYILATPAALVADFTAAPTSGTAPLVVSFNDTSTGNVTAWSWSFGDGNTSSVQNPSHSYTTAGTYAVSLTATGPGVSDTKSQSGYITVTPSGGGGGSTAGLVGAYTFEETSGTIVADASGQANIGTISGATRVTTGRFGKALSFDGVNDWVTVNDAASLDLTTGMTLEAWVYPTVNMSGWQSALIKENPAHGLAYALYANSDTSQPAAYVYVGGDRGLHGGPWLLANTWAHLASTYNGTTHRLYVNGTEVAARVHSGPIEVSSGALRIGGNSFWGEFFQGRIDEVRIYNRALNAAEIQTDMNTAAGPSAPPIRLVGTDTIGSVTDANPQGKAEAFQTYAGTTITGSVISLSVYIDAGSTATQLIAGLYEDKSGHPGDLLAQGTLQSPVAGGWNTVPLPATAINAGSIHWIAILSPSGELRFRDQVFGDRPSETSAQSTLTNLPNTWTTGTVVNEGRLSAYGAGYE